MFSRFWKRHRWRAYSVAILIFGFLGLALPASAVTAGEWTTPQNVASSVNPIYGAQVVSDSSGNLTAIWVEYNGSVDVLHAASQNVGGSWSSAVTLSPAGKSVDSASLVIDRFGNLTAVWRTNESSGYRFQSAMKSPGNSWSAPADLTTIVQSISGASLVVDASGNVTAVWKYYDGTDWILSSATSPVGGSWSTPVNITTPQSSVDLPELVVDSQGLVTAVWTKYDGGLNTVYTASRTPAGVWSSPQNLSTVGFQGYGPQVTIDGLGTVIALWTFVTASDIVVQSASKPVGGTWSSAATETGLGNDFGLTDLASDSAGNLTVLGTLRSGFNSSVTVASKPVGESWMSPVELSDPARDAESARLVVDQSGNATALWQWGSMRDRNWGIQSATRPMGGSWSMPTQLSPVSDNAPYPYLTIGGNGGVLASWSLAENSTNFVQYSFMAWNYRLSYAPNGGSGTAPVEQAGAGGSAITVATGSELTRTGYSFAGWNTRADGTGSAYAAGSSISLSADTTLYAQWTPVLAETGRDETGLALTVVAATVMMFCGLVLVARRRIQH